MEKLKKVSSSQILQVLFFYIQIFEFYITNHSHVTCFAIEIDFSRYNTMIFS